ncbi:AsmA family protein [Lysobacter niastensis]|nr:AsmA family protein [Lysobacter niastensis]
MGSQQDNQQPRGGRRPRDPERRIWAERHPWLSALGLLMLALAVLLAVWDWNWFRGAVERIVEARTGRELDIAGNLDVDLGRTPVLTLDRVRFGNAAWSKEPTMATAERMRMRFALGSLLRMRPRVLDLQVTQPRLLLEANPAGGPGNWIFGTPGRATEVRRLWVDDGRLRFVDTRQHSDLQIGIASQPGQTREDAPIAIVGGGRWKGNAFKVTGNAQSPLALREPEAPYRIDLRATAGATHAHARGILSDPLRLNVFDLQMTLSGRDLADLYPLTGIAIPPTPPYQLDGRFVRDGEHWYYRKFSGRVGDSDMAGDASIDTTGDRPYFRADLRSKRLDIDDLAGFVGGAPQTGQGETSNPELAAQSASAQASGRVLPDTPYELERLRAMDADVRLRAARINAPRLPLDDMDAHLLLENGVLRLDPLDFGVAGGTIRSIVHMDARAQIIRTRADITSRDLELSKLLPQVKLAGNAVGRLGGKVSINGQGNSVARILGSADGQAFLGMGRGKISNLLMEMAGIDLAEIIKFELSGDQLIPLRCAFGDFAIDDGVMTARALAFDTTDTLLVGSGTISLRDEKLDLTIKPRPKDRSLLAFRTPLQLDGTFKHPQLHPDLGRLGLRGGIALTLATITPPAALLATLELGPGEDAGCGGKYAK